MFKKISLAVIGLLASSFVSAGSMGPACTPGNVTVPCETRAWEFGIDALYLTSSYSTQNSITTLVDSLIFPGFATLTAPVVRLPSIPVFQDIDNNWDWGSRLEGAYHFNTGNDFKITWLHYKNSQSKDWSYNVIVNAFADGRRKVDASLNAQDRIDQVNFELGQHVDAGLVKKLRFFGGVQYAHLQVNSTTDFVIQRRVFFAPAPNSEITYNNTDYQGFGPMAGLDYSYNLTDAFSVTASGSGSVLYGTNRYLAGVLDKTGLLSVASVGDRSDLMVPSLQAKLGVNYAYNMTEGQFNIKAGFEALNYFNVLRSQPAGITTNIVTSDYALYGPYAGISYVGNA